MNVLCSSYNQHFRELEEDYTAFAATIVRRSSLSDDLNEGKPMCPICHLVEVPDKPEGEKDNQNVCADCQKLTCDDCGGYTDTETTSVSCLNDGIYQK